MEDYVSRRAEITLSFGGVSITDSMKQYVQSVTYTDNEEDEADDLQIKLQDRDDVWLSNWLNQIYEEAAFTIQAGISTKNWSGEGSSFLDCGTFELDSITAQGPPNTVTIKGTSLPYAAQIRQTLRSQAWESYTLKGIASEMASRNGLSLMYLIDTDVEYARLEQYNEADIAFLSRICHDAGVSLKATSGMLVLFSQSGYSTVSAMTITKGKGSYIKWDLKTNEAKTKYKYCKVSYVSPETGKCIEGMATDDTVAVSGTKVQTLNITAKVLSIGEAQTIAKNRLRQANALERTAIFTFPGNTGLAAGQTVTLSGFGLWDGKSIIKTAKHSVGTSGYTTQITLRKVYE